MCENLNIELPERSENALTGSQFFKTLPNQPTDLRDTLIVKEFLNGNCPSFLRRLKSINIIKNNLNIKLFVFSDYLSIGSDEDFIRIAISAPAAKTIADQINCSLMTSLISDYVFNSSDLKVNPQPLPATQDMITTKYVINHNSIIQKQIKNKEYTLLDGIKKDIILHSSLLLKKNVAIYGWRYPNGQIIQSLNASSHSLKYTDYSQGTRLVSQKVFINDEERNFFDLLNDPNYHFLINSEKNNYDATKIYSF